MSSGKLDWTATDATTDGRFALESDYFRGEGTWWTLLMGRPTDRAEYNRHSEWDCSAVGRGAKSAMKALAQLIADTVDSAADA